jgi:hypothetical protein
MAIIVLMPRPLNVQKRRPVLGMGIPFIARALRLNHSLTLNLGLPSADASITFSASHVEYPRCPELRETSPIEWPAGGGKSKPMTAGSALSKAARTRSWISAKAL